MSAIGFALSAIQAGAVRLENAANNIANLNTPKFEAGIPDQTSGPDGVQITFTKSTSAANSESSNVDLPAQIVDLITAQRGIEANIVSIRTQDEATRSLLNILA